MPLHKYPTFRKFKFLSMFPTSVPSLYSRLTNLEIDNAIHLFAFCLGMSSLSCQHTTDRSPVVRRKACFRKHRSLSVTGCLLVVSWHLSFPCANGEPP
jgi:hypothetical protein